FLRGKTVRKSGLTSHTHTRSSTPQIQSTSTTIFGGGIKDPSGRTSEYSSMEDQCPVCKSDRYLNPKLRLLVSSICYDKMCESCIDRLFTLGPEPCPLCGKVLRKMAFTAQTFEDLGVEKEVAVRRRIAKEFNKRREDFPDLRRFNDYLEEVEDITFNLINEIDVAQTEARIAAYHAENAALIEQNQKREDVYAQSLREQEELERQERELLASALQREEDEEREEREKERRELIDKLETSTKDAAEVIARQRAHAQKQRAKLARPSALLMPAVSHKRVRAAQNNMPHVPLQDDWYAYDDLFVLKPVYNDMFSEAVRYDREGIMRGGGYMVDQAWTRAIRTAVAGFDVQPLSGLDDPQSESASTH
ncbi:CDK-activating kinase assembly factor, partial [Fistulina hepatica ATCC 64428]